VPQAQHNIVRHSAGQSANVALSSLDEGSEKAPEHPTSIALPLNQNTNTMHCNTTFALLVLMLVGSALAAWLGM
jgi:hypothetical protein